VSEDDRDPCPRLRKRATAAGREADGEAARQRLAGKPPPLVANVTLGVIANPTSDRDLRRLVASASVVPSAEKASRVVRLTAVAGALGVGPVLLSTDTFGVSAADLREWHRRAEAGNPRSKLRTAGRIAEANRFRSPVVGSVRLSLTRGARTGTGPAAVITSRSL